LRGSIATAAPAGPDRRHRGALQVRVDAQVDIVAGARAAGVRARAAAAFGIGLDLLVADLAVQSRFVIAFDAGLADMRGSRHSAWRRVRRDRRVDAPDVAHHVREQLALRIEAVR
jgi:hypothetical protein